MKTGSLTVAAFAQLILGAGTAVASIDPPEVFCNSPAYILTVYFEPGIGIDPLDMEGFGVSQTFKAIEEIMDICSVESIEVIGHADIRTPELEQQTISLSRAEAVQIALAERGIERHYLSALGRARHQPIKGAPDNAQINSRVEVVVHRRGLRTDQD